MSTIAIIAALDTKSEEAAFLKRTINKEGFDTIVLDSGMLLPPGFMPDITRQELFAAAGIPDMEAMRQKGKSSLMKGMITGLRAKIFELYSEGRIDGLLSIGGAQGTAVSTAAMQSLPIGFPKVMISTIACGTAQFGDYVGTKDITMIPSICDICGLNSITIPIFSSGCGAVMGMAQAASYIKPASDKPVVALTMAGITTPCVMETKRLLEEKGYETIVFHCNGVGAEIIDELAKAGKLDGVLDISPHEVGGMIYGGLMQSTPERFTNVYESGIPVISVPGGLDIKLTAPDDSICGERASCQHTPFHTHVRTTYQEMFTVGEYTAEKLSSSAGNCAVIVPLRGFSQNNDKGKALYDPDADRGYIDGVRKYRSEKVDVYTFDMHINMPAFAAEIVKTFAAMR